jgi:hypothetical protein
VTRSIGVELDWQVPVNDTNWQWQEYAPECDEFKDNCLEKANSEDLPEPEFEWEYNLIASQNDGKITRKAGDDIREQMLERTNWSESMKKLEN